MSNHPEIDSFLESLNLTYTVRFVPQSLSRNAGKDYCLNWKISISSKGSAQINTDYMQGIGHLKGFNHYDKTIDYARSIKNACETGKWSSSAYAHIVAKTIPAPLLRDVLYSLIMDSDVLNYSSFEEWANNIGFDADSRSAEKIYKECLSQSLQLRILLGNEVLEKLAKLYQDY